MVVDTVRRHPAMLAQTALTLDHLSKGRFVLGLGSGEQENIVPYGFDFARPVSRLEEAIRVIRLLWESDGPVDFEGDFYRLEHARLDTEPFDGKFPEIYMAAGGPRALSICGRLADGWIPGAIRTPDDYADRLSVIREASRSTGRSNDAVTAYFMATCFIGEEQELEEILTAPLVKAYILQIEAKDLKSVGFAHPMGPDWKGIHDIDPGKLTREVIVDLLDRTTPDMLRAWVPHGPPDKIARHFKGFADAGAQIVKMLDYSGMAGTKFAARSAQLTSETEAELLRLCRDG